MPPPPSLNKARWRPRVKIAAGGRNYRTIDSDRPPRSETSGRLQRAHSFNVFGGITRQRRHCLHVVGRWLASSPSDVKSAGLVTHEVEAQVSQSSLGLTIAGYSTTRIGFRRRTIQQSSACNSGFQDRRQVVGFGHVEMCATTMRDISGARSVVREHTRAIDPSTLSGNSEADL